jgi:hypothetical protein
MNCDGIREELEAYALGALDDTVRQRVEMHLRRCDDCMSLYRAYRVTAEELALAVPLYHASPRLKERIMGGIGSFRPQTFGPSFLYTRYAAAAAAIALIAFAAGAIAWAVMLSAEVGELRNDNDRLAQLTQLDAEQRSALLRMQGDLNSAKKEQNDLVNTIEEQATMLVIAFDPDLIPTELEGTAIAPNSECSYVWSGKQSVGALTCKGLPSTSFNVTYELWATKGDKTIAVATFLPRQDGSAQVLVKFPPDAPGPISNLIVTLEQQNAARTKPSTQVILEPSPVQQAVR